MRVCFVSAYPAPSHASASDVIESNYTLREFAENIAGLGHDVQVICLSHQNERLHRNGVAYHFVRPASVLMWLASTLARIRGRASSAHYLPGFVLLRALDEVRPNVIHFAGLTLDLNLWLVAGYAHRCGIPLIVQYHGGEPARSRLRRSLQRQNARLATRILFTTAEHAREWTDAGIPIPSARTVPFMETSSVFTWQPRDVAREKTGMQGTPVFVWTGRLHPLKDPMTALRGFERIQRHWPGAQLYMHYLTDDMLPDLREFVGQRSCLARSVHFRGRAPYDMMESIYNSADFFIQASSRETSGCALLEAMSCGAIPVVTDIPSFRAMTGSGRWGVMFPVGDVDALVDGVLGVPLDSIDTYSSEVRCRWLDALSFPALARQLDAIYRDTIDT